MPVESFILTTSNATLVCLLAVPMWLAWRYLQQPTLKWMTVGYALTGAMYLLAPFTQNLGLAGVNLAATVFTPLFGTAYALAVLHLVGMPDRVRVRLTAATFAVLAGGFAVTLAVNAPTFLRAVLLAIVLLGTALVCFRQARREPQVGLTLVGLSMLAFPAVLTLIAAGKVAPQFQLATVEAPFVAMGLSVMTVLALRSHQRHSSVTARNLELEMEVATLSQRLTQDVAAREAGAQGASRLVDSFNRTVAHDLKGAISAVLAGTQFTRQLLQQGDTAAAIDFLPKVEGQAQAAIERIAAMQRLAQSQSLPLDLREASLEALAKSALSEVKRQQPGHKLDIPIYLMPLPTVVCDPGLIRVLYINLLSNAVKFSQGVPNATVHIGALDDDPSGEPILFIRDTGIGFDPEKAPELFMPFAKRANTGGIGVGVSIVKTIVERHGGRVWVESDEGEGATFFFTLGKPVATSAPARSDGEPAAGHPAVPEP